MRGPLLEQATAPEPVPWAVVLTIQCRTFVSARISYQTHAESAVMFGITCCHTNYRDRDPYSFNHFHASGIRLEGSAFGD